MIIFFFSGVSLFGTEGSTGRTEGLAARICCEEVLSFGLMLVGFTLYRVILDPELFRDDARFGGEGSTGSFTLSTAGVCREYTEMPELRVFW